MILGIIVGLLLALIIITLEIYLDQRGHPAQAPYQEIAEMTPKGGSLIEPRTQAEELVVGKLLNFPSSKSEDNTSFVIGRREFCSSDMTIQQADP
jgi:hypothetical protein